MSVPPDLSQTTRTLLKKAQMLANFHNQNPTKQICGPRNTTPSGIYTEMKMYQGPLEPLTDTYIMAPAPTSLSSAPGNNQVTISFTQSSDGGSSIINYEYSTDNGLTFTPFTPSDTASPVTITNLLNNITYQVQLRAVNVTGPGAPSATINAATFYSPQPPTLVSATPGNNQATITFTAGSNGGAPITNYKY
jgi:hypothetical protein